MASSSLSFLLRYFISQGLLKGKSQHILLKVEYDMIDRNMIDVDDWDYVTSSSSVNFGDTGTTKGILINYSKGNESGRIDGGLGDETVTLIADFSPAHTGDWDVFVFY